MRHVAMGRGDAKEIVSSNCQLLSVYLLVIIDAGRRAGLPLCSFTVDGAVWVPKIPSRAEKAPSVQMTKRPTWPPGASCSRLSDETLATWKRGGGEGLDGKRGKAKT